MSDDNLSIGRISPDDLKMELKCVALLPYQEYLSGLYGEEKVRKIIADTGMNPDYLKNDDNWVSFGYACRLLDKLVEVTGDPEASYLAGRSYSTKKTLGAVGVFLSRFGTPEMMYRLIIQFNDLWNRVSKWQLMSMSKGACVIKVSYPMHKQSRNNCKAIKGMLAAIPFHFFDLQYADVRQRECACDGADSCVYEMTWQSNNVIAYRVIGLIVGFAGLLAVEFFLAGFGTVHWLGVLVLLLGYALGHNLDCRVRLKEAGAQSEKQAASLLDSIRAAERLNEELQRKVEERTAELEKSNKELHQALVDLRDSQEKMLIAEKQAAIGALASGMAHEMNNPLNAISLSLQSIREEVDYYGAVAIQFEISQRALRRCKRVINEMLLFSREPGQIAQLNLVEIVKAAIDIFKTENLSQTYVEFICTEGLKELRLDKLQIQQVLLNLFSNASDAMNGKGKIRVMLAGNGKEQILSVTDHGVGISDDDKKRIFDPFFSTKKSGRGLGLGLSVVYQLVQRNGGVINVESRNGAGTTFYISFPESGVLPWNEGQGMPLSTETSNAEDPGPIISVSDENNAIHPPILHTGNGYSGDSMRDLPGGNIRVLLVEDDPESGLSMKSGLENRNITVTMVESGEDAIKRMEEDRYDIMVTDISLKGMSGIDLLKYGRGKLPEYPVLLITGFDSMSTAIQAVRLGAQDYILKPLESIDLVVAPVVKAVKNYRLFLNNLELEKKLKESEEQYRVSLESAPYGIAVCNKTGEFVIYNSQMMELTGYTKAESADIETWLKNIFPSGNRYGDVNRALFREMDAAKTSSCENIVRHKNQYERICHFVCNALPNGMKIIVAYDVTEYREAEAELENSREQLRALVARLNIVREEEQTKIAREVHDELGHRMTGLKMNLSRLHKKVKVREVIDYQKAEGDIQSMISLIDETIQTARNISAELRPAIIDHLGLGATIEWQVREFEGRTGIECNVNIPDEMPTFESTLSTGMYRIFQEILTNVTRHSGATKVDVTLMRDDSHLVMKVTDDGKGITDTQVSDPMSLGLLGMKERAELLGGTVAIEGVADTGTTVEIRIPVN